jgi:hypothetical protein
MQVNSPPSLSVVPSISPDHHPRTLLIAAKASSGVRSTVMVVVKLFSLIVFSFRVGAAVLAPAMAAFAFGFRIVVFGCASGVQGSSVTSYNL